VSKKLLEFPSTFNPIKTSIREDKPKPPSEKYLRFLDWLFVTYEDYIYEVFKDVNSPSNFFYIPYDEAADEFGYSEAATDRCIKSLVDNKLLYRWTIETGYKSFDVLISFAPGVFNKLDQDRLDRQIEAALVKEFEQFKKDKKLL